MNTSFSASAATPLLFSWEQPQQRKAAITAFLMASLIAHVLCFYVFQIVYPPTVALLRGPERMTRIPPIAK